MNIRKLAMTSAVVLCTVGAGAANAATYIVDRQLGSGASVTGYVETDGALGVLTGSDIIAWNLDLSADHGLYTGNDSNTNSGVFLVGTDVTATATGLYFNYGSGDGGSLLFQQSHFSGTYYWCVAQGSPCLQGETVATGSYLPPQGLTVSASGIQQIAGVPEPATWAMLLLGFFGIGFMARGSRRKLGTAAAA